MSQIAASFLRRCFAPEETIALLLRGQDGSTPMQRVVRLEQVLESRYIAWLSYENQHGRNNIYVAANPLRPGSRKRTKECIASVRHLYLDIDTDGDVRLSALRVSELVPPPTSLLSTSPGKYQVLWRVEGFDFMQQEHTLKLLALAFGGDPACTDCNRVLRVPGFLNRKYDPPCKVVVEYPDDSVWTPDDFQLEAGAVDAMLPGDKFGSRKPPLKHSHSESDWAWVMHELAHGKDAVTLTHELASRRSDKSNPLYYAQRTIDVASARLWLIEGSSFDDIIAMLEARRCSEIPAALCSARAREIATTARHMIATESSLDFTPKENAMPLLEVTQTRHLSASIRLTDTTATQVDQYAAFIHASANDVVEQALAYVFSKDRDFQEYLKSPEAQKVTPTLRVRRAPANEAAEKPVKKPASAASSAPQTPAVVAGSRA